MNNNSVELIGIYGDDEIIACSAWTSTSRELTMEKKNRINQLINELWNNGHETPFEKAVVHQSRNNRKISDQETLIPDFSKYRKIKKNKS